MSDSHGTPQGSASPHAPVVIPGAGGQHHEEEGGEGNWLVSYADMMTLLVGFFVILLSFSTVDNDKFEELKKATTQQFGGIYQEPYSDISDRLKEALNKLGLGQQFAIKQTDLGVEISFLGTVFFATGSADMKAEGTELLKQLIPIIKAEKTDFNITIEGHTDDVPIAGGALFRNNWELSSLRSCRVLSVFEQNGFDKSRLTALGFGEARPVVPNRDKDGNAIERNQSQNRRVVIKLLKRPQPSMMEKEEAPGPGTSPAKSGGSAPHGP